MTCTMLRMKRKHYTASNMISVNEVINEDQTGPSSVVECLVQLVRKLGSVTVSNHLSLKFLIHILTSISLKHIFHLIGHTYIKLEIGYKQIYSLFVFYYCVPITYMVQCHPHVIL